MVILIIGILIAGVVLGNNLVKKSRISSAQTLTISSPINGIKESALWLESSLDKSFEESESFDNNPISRWGDNRGGAANKVSVTAVGGGPVYSNTINYVRAVKFNGSASDYLQINDASFLNNTDYTIFVLEKRESSVSDNYFIGDSSLITANQNLILGYSSNQQVIHSQAGSNSYNSSISGYADSTKPRVFTFVSDSINGKKTYINGVLAAQSSDVAQLSGISTLAIGKNYTGQIGEIAIFTRPLKAEERKSVEDYIGKKWTTKINRDFVNSGSCVGYTVTDRGCDMSSATCSIDQTGLTATVSPASSPTPISCNSHYSGTVTYTCINGTPSVSGSCSCATGYMGTGCNTCNDGLGYVSNGSGGCVMGAACAITVAGVPAGGTINHGLNGSSSCTATNYGGTASYSCDNGSLTITQACTETCTINVTGVANKVVNKVATTTLISCDSGYTGNYSYTCGSAGVYATVSNTCARTPTTIYLTGSGTWTVPSDWISAANTIEVIGGGASNLSSSGAGGGGGAYSKISNLTLTPGASVSYSVGAGGTAGYNSAEGRSGGDTWFNGATYGVSSVAAKGGVRGSSTTAGSGGSSGSGIGAVKYAGGNGGVGASYAGGGGGGAAGPNGNGAAGGAGGGINAGAAGGGGGGGTSGGNAGNATSGTGGLGANGGGTVIGTGGAGTSTGTVSGGNGSASSSSGGGGGGGGGVGSPPSSGGNGGAGKEWDASHGSGGGGGGAGDQPGGGVSTAKGGNGGLYGGGGGGSGADAGNYGGAGAPGIIVIKY